MLLTSSLSAYSRNVAHKKSHCRQNKNERKDWQTEKQLSWPNATTTIRANAAREERYCKRETIVTQSMRLHTRRYKRGRRDTE